MNTPNIELLLLHRGHSGRDADGHLSSIESLDKKKRTIETEAVFASSPA